MRAAVITISTSKARGEGEDLSGPELERLVLEAGGEVAVKEIITDKRELIESLLRELCDNSDCDLVLTTGGTGFAPNDVTPEATRAVIERPAAGLVEAIRRQSLEKTPYAMLSRAEAGIRGKTLIINLPGSPKAVTESFAVLSPVLAHSLDLIAERGSGHDEVER